MRRKTRRRPSCCASLCMRSTFNPTPRGWSMSRADLYIIFPAAFSLMLLANLYSILCQAEPIEQQVLNGEYSKDMFDEAQRIVVSLIAENSWAEYASASSLSASTRTRGMSHIRTSFVICAVVHISSRSNCDRRLQVAPLASFASIFPVIAIPSFSRVCEVTPFASLPLLSTLSSSPTVIPWLLDAAPLAELALTFVAAFAAIIATSTLFASLSAIPACSAISVEGLVLVSVAVARFLPL